MEQRGSSEGGGEGGRRGGGEVERGESVLDQIREVTDEGGVDAEERSVEEVGGVGTGGIVRESYCGGGQEVSLCI
jgi:hypothetical protein